MKRAFTLLVLLMFWFLGNSQIIFRSGQPLKLLSKDQIPRIELPSLDYERLAREDKQNPLPYRVGVNVRYSVDFRQLAKKVELKDKNVWYLRITSPNGIGLSVIFDKFKLAKGAEIYLYSADGKVVFGPITEKNNKPFGLLATRELPTLDLIIEYHEPKSGNSVLWLGDVVQYYRGFKTTKVGESEPCEVNINCPEGAAWQTEKHAVARYTFREGVSYYLCSGALVANTAFDETPYFLTANHCVSENSVANTAVFYFNYEANDCEGNSYNPGQTISGATLRATGEIDGTPHLDFSLLQLSQVPPPHYSPYYAGWSRVSDQNAIDSSVCIHHPQGDLKKITKDFDSPTVGSFSGFDNYAHWRIITWEVGTTEPGSSGSPLFDQGKRVIGDLTGGSATCDNSGNDYFARFDLSWDKYDDTAAQLKYWLDPVGLNPLFIDGYNPYNVDLNVNLAPVHTINGYVNGTVAHIFWLAPDQTQDSVIYDGFENYPDFALSIPNWTAKDLDQGPTWGIEGVEFENENYVGAFIVFNPSKVEPENPKGWEPHSGNKYLAFFDTQPDHAPNNDWLISPQMPVTETSKLIFYAKSVSDKYNLERFRVMVSDKSANPEDFVKISDGEYVEVPTHWTRYEYDLSQFAGKNVYVAINVVSDNGFALLLDDISITTDEYPQLKSVIADDQVTGLLRQQVVNKTNLATLVEPQLENYLVYRNYVKIAELPPSQKYYIDTLRSDGQTYSYYVVAVYDSGRALPSDLVYLKYMGQDTVTNYQHDNSVSVNPNLIFDQPVNIEFNREVSDGLLRIIRLDGKVVKEIKLNKVKTIRLSGAYFAPGVYYVVVYTNNETYQTVFIKI